MMNAAIAWLSSPAGLTLGGAALAVLSCAALRAWRRALASRRGPREQPSGRREFEARVLAALKRQGYHVSETASPGAAGQFDVVVRKNRESYLVLLRHLKTARVDIDAVRGLYGVITSRGAVGGIVVTTGRFSRDATQFARPVNITLIDGALLQQMLSRHG